MRVLLDTHAFLWYMEGSAELGAAARQIIGDRSNERLISSAALWEIAVKQSIGKLHLGAPFGALIPRSMEDNGFELLPITLQHLAAVAVLPFPGKTRHKDPFDRLMVAQAMAEDIPFLSRDRKFGEYGVEIIWQGPGVALYRPPLSAVHVSG